MSEGRQSFWTTVPGILTGLAALITALVTAGAFFLGAHDSGDSTAGGAADGSAAGDLSAAGAGEHGDPPPSGTAAATVTSAPAAAPADGGRTAGTKKVVLRDGDYYDIDAGVQGNSVSGEDLSWDGLLSLNGIRNAVVPAATDEAGCMAALQTRSDGYLAGDDLTNGAVVCLTTHDGVLAQVAIAPPDPAGNLTLQLTVWR